MSRLSAWLDPSDPRRLSNISARPLRDLISVSPGLESPPARLLLEVCHGLLGMTDTLRVFPGLEALLARWLLRVIILLSCNAARPRSRSRSFCLNPQEVNPSRSLCHISCASGLS